MPSLEFGPCSASPIATAACTVACLESHRTMRRYALLACSWSVGCLTRCLGLALGIRCMPCDVGLGLRWLWLRWGRTCFRV
jgi:hypothetical protein